MTNDDCTVNPGSAVPGHYDAVLSASQPVSVEALIRSIISVVAHDMRSAAEKDIRELLRLSAQPRLSEERIAAEFGFKCAEKGMNLQAMFAALKEAGNAD